MTAAADSSMAPVRAPARGAGAGVRRAAGAGWAVLMALAMATTASAAEVRVSWIDARGEDSILVLGGLVAFHGGEVDWYDHDRPAPSVLANTIRGMFGSAWPSMQQILATTWRDAVVRSFLLRPTAIGGPGITPPNWPRYDVAGATLDPLRHRYLSFLLPVQPSNDAVVGNEDPRRFELFDDEGRFLGPLFIDVYGSDVVDAGVCDNTETGLAWLELPGGSVQPCAGGEGLVLPHPGLNGSRRNPDGEPVRVLGATSTAPYTTVHYFDPVAADFTRPGQHLGRLVISSSTSWFGASGSWFSPERAGEGFSLQVLPAAAPGGRSRALVYWYTYAPDGSGQQLWLTGLGEITGYNLPSAQVDLHRTAGGRFASTSNPDTVVATPWGSLRLEFTDCDQARVDFESLDDSFGSGSFSVRRLGPPVEGLAWLCDPGDAALPDAGADAQAQTP
jgi:hypothetical protein